MKTRALILLQIVITSFAAFSQCDWAPLGPSDYNQPSNNVANCPKLTSDASGNIYIGFGDNVYSYKASVKKYNGTTWAYYGPPGFSAGNTNNNDVAIDNAGTIYVAFSDGTLSNKLTVMKYNGSAWVIVGSAGFSPGAANGVGIAIAPSGDPYVAFADGANGNKGSVMYYNGSAWTYVGPTNITAGTVGAINIGINASSSVYVGYVDGANGNKGTVQTYSNSSWTNVGLAGFTGSATGAFDMCLDNNGFPFVAFQDSPALTGRAMSYNGTSWSNVGATSVFTTGIGILTCAVGASNTPYVLFSVPSNNGKEVVRTFNGTNWVTYGNPYNSAAGFSNPHMIVDNTNTPVFGWTGMASKAEVFRYNNSTSIWDRLGTLGFSTLGSNNIDIKIAPGDTAYAVYSDGGYQNKAVVKKYNGTGWVTVGNPGFPSTNTLSSSSVSNTALMFLSTGVPYVVLSEYNQGNKVYVKKLNNNSWQDVDQNGVSQFGADWPSIVHDSFDSVYVGYMDIAGGNKANVKKFNGTTWVNVGPPNFSSGTAVFTSLTISNADTLYMAYGDGTQGGKATVKKYLSGSWVTVGNAGFSTGVPYVMQIKTDNYGVPYVVFRDQNSSLKPTVMCYNSGSWITLSAVGLPTTAVTNVSMVFDSANTPYILYGDGVMGSRGIVKKYNGSSWTTVGTPWFTAYNVVHPSLAIDANDVLYMGFSSDGSFAYRFNFLPSGAVSNACNGNSVTLSAAGGTLYSWTGPNSFNSSNQNILFNPVTYSNSGIYTVSISSGSCTATKTVNLLVNASPTVTVNSGSICSSNSFTLLPSGASTYTFSSSQIVTPSVTSTYSVIGTNTSGCVSLTPAIANVSVSASPTISVSGGSVCSGQSFTINPSGANSFTIEGGNSVVTPSVSTNYTVTGTSTNNCVSASAATCSVTVFSNPTLSVLSGSICNGQSFTISPGGASSYTIQGGNSVVTPNASTSYTITGTATNNCVSTTAATCNVVVFPNPTVSVSSGSICNGQSFTINPSGASTFTIEGGNSIVTPSASTNYTVMGTNTNNCVSATAGTCSIFVFTDPTVSILTNSNIICIGQSATLTANGAISYTWTGNISSSNISVSPTVTSTYSVVGTDVNGCTATALITQSVSNCSGIVENENPPDNKVLIFPNPTNGLFFIVLPAPARVIIRDVSGKVIAAEQKDQGSYQFNVSELCNGLYFLEVSIDSNVRHYKLIKN
jgi:hypothetical protein